MQSRLRLISSGVAVAVLGIWSQVGLAQGNCGNIQFSADITNRFPNARNACLEVVQRDGRPFAHFQARVNRVRGDTVEAEFKQPNGTWGRPVSFRPAPGARARIQGQTYRFTDLTRGQELDVYLPPDRWAIAVQEDPATEFLAAPTIIFIALEEVEPTVTANLPRTGSPLPLFGVLVLLLTGHGPFVPG